MNPSDDSTPHEATSESDATRRKVLITASRAAMAAGLCGGYGAFAYTSGRFLLPTDDGSTAWQYAALVDELADGQSIEYTAPSGLRVTIARRSEGNTAESFVALSSICPHLGCQVHWQAQPGRFFCPCHNGAFDAEGRATEGPPAAAKQSLTNFPIRIEGPMLFVRVPLHSVVGPHFGDAV